MEFLNGLFVIVKGLHSFKLGLLEYIPSSEFQ